MVSLPISPSADDIDESTALGSIYNPNRSALRNFASLAVCRFPKALPPYAENPSAVATTLIHFLPFFSNIIEQWDQTHNDALAPGSFATTIAPLVEIVRDLETNLRIDIKDLCLWSDDDLDTVLDAKSAPNPFVQEDLATKSAMATFKQNFETEFGSKSIEEYTETTRFEHEAKILAISYIVVKSIIEAAKQLRPKFKDITLQIEFWRRRCVIRDLPSGLGSNRASRVHNIPTIAIALTPKMADAIAQCEQDIDAIANTADKHFASSPDVLKYLSKSAHWYLNHMIETLQELDCFVTEPKEFTRTRSRANSTHRRSKDSISIARAHKSNMLGLAELGSAEYGLQTEAIDSDSIGSDAIPRGSSELIPSLQRVDSISCSRQHSPQRKVGFGACPKRNTRDI